MSHTHARATPEQVANRQALLRLFEQTPLPTDELLVNLPLYMRSSTVAKLLYIDELYRRIVNVPGVIVEFGVWWGANLALFESLRAVYEPYNFTRSIIGFDTFEGHTSTSPQDGTVAAEAAERYRLRNDYPDYLGEVLKYHRRENPMGHLTRQEVIKGDAGDGLERYLEEHPETIVALAYFDMQLYEPTKRCLELIRPRMTRGSVIAMDELNSSEFPGETIAFAETIGLDGLRLRRSRYLPDRTYGTVE